MHDLKIVDVNANREQLITKVSNPEGAGSAQHKNAGVGVVELLEALLLEPREEHALEAAPSLLDAIDGLLDASQLGAALIIELLPPGRQMAVDDLALHEAALEVRGNQVGAANFAAIARRVRE